MSKSYLMLPVFILMISCASSQEKWVNTNCSAEGAYAIGAKDGQFKRRNGATALHNRCPKSMRSSALSSYAQGVASKGGQFDPETHDFSNEGSGDIIEFLNKESRPQKKKEVN
jgi:hypothetical protein